MLVRLVSLGLASSLFGCSSVVFDDGIGGGATTTTSTSTTSGPSSTQGSSMGCSSHDHCLEGVCLFATGECAPACDGGFCECEAGTVCNTCATSSCPKCNDCLGACVPVAEGQCSSASDCKEGETCLFERSICVPLCKGEKCEDPGESCKFCATGSCCGCDDCVDVCLPLD